MRAPFFWYSDHRTLASYLLMPLGGLYGLSTRLRAMVTTRQKVETPVICIGNFVAGGAGKTPTVLALAKLLKQQDKTVGLLTRGYGGALAGPLFVDADSHGFGDVGDEALLLAQSFPTIVAKDRPAGARKFATTDTDIILMDDGFQNPALHKDLCLIVIDHQQGIGNGCIIPAGPLRGPLAHQISQASGFVIIGGALVDRQLQKMLQESRKPTFTAHLEKAATAPDLTQKKVIAFTGIAQPDKFFATLESAGAEIIERIRFPDHHPFSTRDAERLLGLQADNPNCLLVTTAKDRIRLKAGFGAGDRLYHACSAYDVDLKFDQEKLLTEFVLKAV